MCIAGDGNEFALKQMKETAALLPSASLEVIGDAQSPSNLCQPQTYNRAVLAFLAAQRLRDSVEE